MHNGERNFLRHLFDVKIVNVDYYLYLGLNYNYFGISSLVI